MKCPSCLRETSPIHIGQSDFCSVCGNRYTATPIRVRPAATRQLDVAKAARPVAANLHRGRGTGKGVIDLRTQAQAKAGTIQKPLNHTPAPAPSRTAAVVNHRLNQAKQVERSPLVNKFAGIAQPTSRPVAPVPSAQTPTRASTPQTPQRPGSELPALAATHHRAMARLPLAPQTAQTAQPVRPPANTPRRSLAHASVKPLTVAAALIIMGGYVWLQNYPKLALQSAGNAAGLAATLPGYVPSSYNLAKTQASPGIVTLNFTSPSIGEILKIHQNRTSWDSSSLLDNFVSKQSDDYSTVHGQGLTIYLFGQNRAAWVNHGIWYSIDGAARLSREQILKIAYSL